MGIHQVRYGELVVLAVMAVNAAGDLRVEPEGADTSARIAASELVWPEADQPLSEATTIGVVVTNARFDKTGCRMLAEAAHDGLARAVVPAHTPFDGDAVVAVSAGSVEAPPANLRAMAAAAVEQAIGSVRAP